MAISGVGMTAKMAAAGRALESRRPDRLFDDPLAQALAGEDGFRWMEQMRPPGSHAENPSIGPRTWFFDQLITRAAGDGVRPRVFELALFAYFREQGYDLDRTGASPDFIIGGSTSFAVEATTANPADTARPGERGLPADGWPFLPDDLPGAQREFVFQIGKVLRRKLLKRDAAGRAYWELPRAAAIPFVIAVEAFHSGSSLFHSVGFAAAYLYGRRDAPGYDGEGRPQSATVPVTEYRHGGKAIPGGLFALPEARPLSAVLFSNSSTVALFNRIGTERGYGPDDVALARVGTWPGPDPDVPSPRLFGYVVEQCPPGERETFGEALHILHNPWAEIPLSAGAFRGVTEYALLEDGRVVTAARSAVPIASQTMTFTGRGARPYARTYLARWAESLTGHDASPAEPRGGERPDHRARPRDGPGGKLATACRILKEPACSGDTPGTATGSGNTRKTAKCRCSGQAPGRGGSALAVSRHGLSRTPLRSVRDFARKEWRFAPFG
jgi:hypothetical protein